jgi:pyruvate/2-oxoglutarate dehydrogenase complex dihydrolipoamide acyltransferase (E2) component
MAKEKATEAAEKKAAEEGVKVEKVEGSGAGGKVTVSDVERAAAEPEKSYEARLPEGTDGVVVGGRLVRDGDPITEGEYEALASPKPLSKGKEL